MTSPRPLSSVEVMTVAGGKSSTGVNGEGKSALEAFTSGNPGVFTRGFMMNGPRFVGGAAPLAISGARTGAVALGGPGTSKPRGTSPVENACGFSTCAIVRWE